MERKDSTYFAAWSNPAQTVLRTLTCSDTRSAMSCVAGIDATTEEDLELLVAGWSRQPVRLDRPVSIGL